MHAQSTTRDFAVSGTKSFSQRVSEWLNEDVFAQRQSSIRAARAKEPAPSRPFVTRPVFAEALKVITGDFHKSEGCFKKGDIYLPVTWSKFVKYGLGEIANLEIVGTDQGQANSVGAAMLGGLLLGGAGLIAGAVAGKKSQVHFAVAFRDGKRALLSSQADVYARIKFERDGLTPPPIPESAGSDITARHRITRRG